MGITETKPDKPAGGTLMFTSGDRVTTKPGPNAVGGNIGVVTCVREGHKRSVGPAVEVQVEFQGREWFYPYWATFKPDELVLVGHGDATKEPHAL